MHFTPSVVALLVMVVERGEFCRGNGGNWLQILFVVLVMAFSHCRTRIGAQIPNPMGTLYYAEVFTLVQIWIWMPTQMISQMVIVPILGMDLHPKDRSPSQFYYISIRGSESESEPMGNFCIVQ